MTYEEAKGLVNMIEEMEGMLHGFNKVANLMTPDVLGLGMHPDEVEDSKNIFGNLIAKLEGEIEVLKLGFDG